MGIETFRPHPRGGGSPTHACHSIPSYNDPLNDLGYRWVHSHFLSPFVSFTPSP